MKTVTQTFTDNLLEPDIQVIRSVSYKRRYFTGSSYAWESGWTALSESMVVNVSPITTQLDTSTQNEYKISNVTLTLDNLKNQWLPSNTYGLFGPDAVSPTYGYEAYLMKFRVQSGLIYPDGTQELVTLFTGVLTDLNFSSDDGCVQVTVSGEQTLLQNANAEAVSTTATNESLGTGDGSTTVFLTAHKGVGIIKSVTVSGALKRPGVDYTTSQLNDTANFGKITFTAAPAVAAPILCTYIYWQTLQKFETLVANLATQAGIAGGNQQVSPVLYPNSIINTHTWQTQSDWQGGSSLTAIDTTTLVNSIKLDFQNSASATQTPYSESLTYWTSAVAGGHGAGWFDASLFVRFQGGSLNGNTTWGSIYRSQTAPIGGWKFTTNMPNASSNNPGCSLYYFFMAGSISTANGVNTGISGYSIALSPSGNTGKVCLVKHSNASGDPTANATVLGTYTPATTNAADFLVVRYPSGRIVVSYNGTPVIDIIDTTYTTTNYICFYIISPDKPSGGLNFFDLGQAAGGGVADVIWVPSTTLTGTWVSNTIDFGSTPTAWSAFLHSETLNGGTITYYSRTSPDGSTWDSYVAITAGIVASTLRRYIQIEAVLVATLASSNDPYVSSLTVGSTTTSTVISLANFTGLTCYQAIQQIAALANYEFGFDSVENFFFRPKTTLSPVMSISQSNFIQAILSTLTGNDQVYTAVRATYGSYTQEVDDTPSTNTSPTYRIGFALYQASGGNLLISADADIATGVANAFYSYYKLPRRKYKLSVKFLPQLDLSDVVTTTFADNLPPRGWYWGDSSAYYGLSSIYYYGYAEQSIYGLNCKVVGQRIDTENWTCELDLEEVLS